MDRYNRFKTAFYFLLIILFVAGSSMISVRIWGSKSEQSQQPRELIIEDEMTVSSFGQTNGVQNNILKEIFDLKDKSDLTKRLDEYGTPDQIKSMVVRKLALASERTSKNWVKIPIKFTLWFIFLAMTFILLKKKKTVSAIRNRLLFSAVLLFGVIMGSDPGPMGTVKDAIHLFAVSHALFLPRIIALSVFLAMVFMANKYICAWGCQAGTLQDLIFRINQTQKHKAIIGKRIKLPFALTNTVRFAFLFIFTILSFLWGLDLIEPIDPFKIYNPARIGIIGGGFIFILLLACLFIYRPWCHLFCPFGLAGWVVEKASLIKISVDYETCIACQRCASVCPSTVMGAILRRDKKTIPDCFACYTCREVCPTDSISFSFRKRTLPPPDLFDKGNRNKTNSLE